MKAGKRIFHFSWMSNMAFVRKAHLLPAGVGYFMTRMLQRSIRGILKNE